MTTSAEIRAALTLRYPKGSHALMFEVAPETGGGTRYADAVAVGLWKSHGHLVEGFEIKVSRSDLASELKKPEKSQPVFQYCHRWWLATPKGLADPAELPPNWGLLELVGSALKVKVKATPLVPVPVTTGFFASLVRRSGASVTDELEVLMRAERARIEKEVEARFQQRHRHDRDLRAQKVESGLALIEKIKAETGIDFADHEWNRPDWLSACRVLATLGLDSSYSGLKSLRDGASKLAATIDNSGLLAAPAPETGT